MPNVRDHDLSVYLRLQGNGLSIGGYEPHPDMLPEVLECSRTTAHLESLEVEILLVLDF